jgi:DNA primase
MLDAAKPLVDMLWFRETRGVDLATPERRAGLEQALRNAVAAIGDTGVRRHYEMAVRERADRQFRPAFKGRGGRPAAFAGKRGRFPPQPTGPSASLLSNALVRERGRGGGQGPSLSDAVLIGILLRHPEIASARLELFGQAQFTGSAVLRWPPRLLPPCPSIRGLDAAELAESLGRQGMVQTAEAVLESSAAWAWRASPRAMRSMPPASGMTLPTCVFVPERYLSSVRQQHRRSGVRRATSIW